jgi:hypothetical protein
VQRDIQFIFFPFKYQTIGVLYTGDRIDAIAGGDMCYALYGQVGRLRRRSRKYYQ